MNFSARLYFAFLLQFWYLITFLVSLTFGWPIFHCALATNCVYGYIIFWPATQPVCFIAELLLCGVGWLACQLGSCGVGYTLTHCFSRFFWSCFTHELILDSPSCCSSAPQEVKTMKKPQRMNNDFSIIPFYCLKFIAGGTNIKC